MLDLFCGAGGTAKGYQRAGFEVVGVDINPQPRYCGDHFDQADALKYVTTHYREFDVIHASPPCQYYANVTQWRGRQRDHDNLIGLTRTALKSTGLPYVIENVPEAPVRPDYRLCGTMFGLPIRRHRDFELNWGRLSAPAAKCGHHATDMPFMHKYERAYADAMGCGWMTSREARQAVPPLYALFIGELYFMYLEEAAA